MGEDWIEQLMRDYQDSITTGVYDGVFRLPAAEVDTVMQCQAGACVEAFVKLYDLPDTLDFDTFLSRMTIGGPSKINIRRDGDVMYWEEMHEGQCMCPLVRRSVIALTPGLCGCAAHWLRMLVERFARRPARVELLESVADGRQNCVFRVTLGEAPAA